MVFVVSGTEEDGGLLLGGGGDVEGGISVFVVRTLSAVEGVSSRSEMSPKSSVKYACVRCEMPVLRSGGAWLGAPGRGSSDGGAAKIFARCVMAATAATMAGGTGRICRILRPRGGGGGVMRSCSFRALQAVDLCT